MRIVQIILNGASEYERRAQANDFTALAEHLDVVLAPSIRDSPRGDLFHLYAPLKLPAADVARIPGKYVASGAPTPSFFRRPPTPAARISPLKELEPFHYIPESVAAPFLTPAEESVSVDLRHVGYFRGPRSHVAAIVGSTVSRLQRVRDDIRLVPFDQTPTPAQLNSCDAWLDPTTDQDDYDGFVAEALVSGRVVVASRTPINSQRLEKGRAGLLVPPGDPNELAHAILTALFKPEVAREKTDSARQTAGRFHPRHRVRALIHLYQTLT